MGASTPAGDGGTAGAGAEDEILYEEQDRVAYIRFNRPEAMNAFSREMRQLLAEHIARAEVSPAVGCIVLTGVGRAFSAGADVKRLGSSDVQRSRADTLLDDVDALRRFQRETVLKLHGMAKPSIAAVNGHAFGVGLSFAMCCDIRYAARSARLCPGFGRIAITGDTGLIWFLTRTIGRAATLEWLYTSEILSADEAAQRGVVNQVFDDAAFAERTHELAARIAAGSSRTNAGLKANVELALQADLATSLHQEALSISTDLLSEDHREAVRALLEKRPPRFNP
ncbi:MAG: enoyl-CoA hydratase/isomerase family protein [Sphingomonadaceae bacterium]|nr:enoyl-CoA hydratase/isomerase family protein [Sphingomonadaceae bacterium]